MQHYGASKWQEALKDAIASTDQASARSKIQSAEVAIFNRIRGFVPGRNTLEEQALFDALGIIRDLKARAGHSHGRSGRVGRNAPPERAVPMYYSI